MGASEPGPEESGGRDGRSAARQERAVAGNKDENRNGAKFSNGDLRLRQNHRLRRVEAVSRGNLDKDTFVIRRARVVVQLLVQGVRGGNGVNAEEEQEKQQRHRPLQQRADGD